MLRSLAIVQLFASYWYAPLRVLSTFRGSQLLVDSFQTAQELFLVTVEHPLPRLEGERAPATTTSAVGETWLEVHNL